MWYNVITFNSTGSTAKYKQKWKQSWTYLECNAAFRIINQIQDLAIVTCAFVRVNKKESDCFG